jgi:hypothetical protein
MVTAWWVYMSLLVVGAPYAYFCPRWSPPDEDPATPRRQGLGGRRTGLNKTETEDLLDWLEGNGYKVRELSYDPGRGFSVQYQEGQGA